MVFVFLFYLTFHHDISAYTTDFVCNLGKHENIRATHIQKGKRCYAPALMLCLKLELEQSEVLHTSIDAMSKTWTGTKCSDLPRQYYSIFIQVIYELLW